MKNQFSDYLLPIIFFIIGVTIFLVLYHDIKWGIKSKNWPWTEGAVIASKIKSSSSNRAKEGSTTTYNAEILYEYEVDNRKYTSKQKHFGNCFPGNVQDVVSQYPPGKQLLVYYNPESPEMAVLRTGTAIKFYLFISISPLLIIFAVVYLIGLIKKDI
jgi:hypothetical protein